MKKRKERFSMRAADLIDSVNACKKEIKNLNNTLIKHLRQDLEEKFDSAIKTRDYVDIKSYLEILNNYIELGGEEDAFIKQQKDTISLVLAAKGPINTNKD